ncbi:hypothetical protein PG993_011998 [Apiospora rasikravindrae]|uniref:Uncharacterized protein n=1 Tax=Apiospora rasikravindrae TaxID=990691 RepID=A0ABR1S2L5_9PEZI
MQSFNLKSVAAALAPLLALATTAASAPVPSEHAARQLLIPGVTVPFPYPGNRTARQLVVPGITVPIRAAGLVAVERFADNFQQSLLETIPTNTTGVVGEVAINNATYSVGDLNVAENSGVLRNAVLEAVNDEIPGEIHQVQMTVSITIPVVALNHTE